MVDAILDALSASDCSAVTSAQLASITGLLNLNDEGLDSLRSGDFDGLTNLRALNLYRNSLTTLPPDVFDGLSDLDTLNLWDNDLTALPSDVFDGLSDLQFLNLYENALTVLPSDVFDGLSQLRNLYLYDNSLAALPPDVFDGLSRLDKLRLDNNSLACVHTGQFDGLSNLGHLHLSGNELGNIAPGYFQKWGLNDLEELRFGDTLIGESAVDFAAYEAVLPTLDASKTYVQDTADLSDPVCGFITADTDGAYHGTVRVRLDEMSVRPNRARASDASLLGDGVCGSDQTMTQHVLWTWQRSEDGRSWTDTPNQPEAYGVRAEGECSFTYTPQAGDDGMYIRAYVPVNTAGVGRHDYHTAAFGPLDLRP